MGIVVFGLTMFTAGVVLGCVARPNGKASLSRIDSAWMELPSGWSREVRGLSAYAMTPDGSTAYWWVSRSGRTLVEGPAASLETAKVEAEREALELSR